MSERENNKQHLEAFLAARNECRESLARLNAVHNQLLNQDENEDTEESDETRAIRNIMAARAMADIKKIEHNSNYDGTKANVNFFVFNAYATAQDQRLTELDMHGCFALNGANDFDITNPVDTSSDSDEESASAEVEKKDDYEVEEDNEENSDLITTVPISQTEPVTDLPLSIHNVAPYNLHWEMTDALVNEEIDELSDDIDMFFLDG